MTNTLVITGDTFSSRQELKAMGGRWVPHLKAWLLPEDQRYAVAQLQAIIGFSVSLASIPGRPSRLENKLDVVA